MRKIEIITVSPNKYLFSFSINSSYSITMNDEKLIRVLFFNHNTCEPIKIDSEPMETLTDVYDIAIEYSFDNPHILLRFTIEYEKHEYNSSCSGNKQHEVQHEFEETWRVKNGKWVDEWGMSD